MAWEPVRVFHVLTVSLSSLYNILIQLPAEILLQISEIRKEPFGLVAVMVQYSMLTEITLFRFLLSNTSRVSDIIQGPDDLIYILPQGKGIFSIDPENKLVVKEYSISIDPVMFSAAFTYSGKLLIGTQENLLVCTLG